MIRAIILALYVSCMAVCGLWLILNVIALIKNEFTYRNHNIILYAIYDYSLHLIEEGRHSEAGVLYWYMESYDATLKRWWDWGYTRILPPDKFELIKPFIKHRKESRR